MKDKKNDLWRLDLLEAKFTQNSPRFPLTKKLLAARNNAHVLKKLPTTPNEAFLQIHALKADLFAKKYHGSYTKLQREVMRRVKQDTRNWTDDQKKLKDLLSSHDFLDQLISSKLVKTISASVLNTKDSKMNPPTYIPEDIRGYISDKSNPKNPSHFFITHCQNDKLVNGYVSKLWNCADIKRVLQESEWSFRKIRGNLSSAELSARTKDTGRKTIEEGSGSEPESESESESGSGSNSGSESDSDSNSDESENDKMDAEEAFDKFASYDNLVADSDDENEFVADPNVNYNEITDEEMSEDEEEEEEKPKKVKEKKEKKENKVKEKIVLPQLATGYFSGGSDDEDIDNDKVVKEATTVRKNRRGQRARQKIWEQKYGSSAAHVQKEKLRIASEREQHQREFEERQRKRELKAKAAEQNGQYKDSGSKPTSAHPSWEAKKNAEEKMKNAKFQGKKITFD